jgi:hypothetical protein
MVEQYIKLLVVMRDTSEKAESLTRDFEQIIHTQESIDAYFEDMKFLQANFDTAKAEMIAKLNRIKFPCRKVTQPPSSQPGIPPIDRDAFDDIADRRGEDS